MKKIILFFSLMFFFANIHCFAQDEGLVYLRVATTAVSSFDATPDWAPPQDPKATIDRDLLTRWASHYTDNQWISFDFGMSKTLSKITIVWEPAYAADYDILISDDNQNWQVLKSVKGSKGGTEDIAFVPVKARYVKILGIKRVNPDWGISIWETLFFGPEKDNPGDKPLAEVYPELAKQLSAKEAKQPEELEKPVPSPGPLTLKEFQKGVVYTSWGSAELGSSASDKTLEYLSNLGVRHLEIMVVWFQDSEKENSIYADPKDTPTDSALIHAINKAHSLGMKVMMKPHLDIKTGQSRIDIVPSEEWFKSYKDYLLRYAKLSSQYNVESFSIGTELLNTTITSWQPAWEGIIKEIRSVFSGPLIYGANWDEFKTVGFWDKLDFIGIDAYFPLASQKNPKKEELISSWKGIVADMDKWLKEKNINKPIIFTELGYCSAEGTSVQPWNVLSNLPEKFVNQQEQADALDAMLEVCPAYSWFKGFYWWNYFPQDRWSPLGYTIRGKKAEDVLSGWFKKIKE